MEKIKNFIKNIFWKNNSRSNKVLYKLPKKTFRKRNYLNIKFNHKKYLKFFKKNYIPYYLIFWFTFLVIIFFIILWPIFRVENINILKKDAVTNINIAYRALDDFRWDSIFSIEKNEILERLKNYQENIRDIDLSINFPKTIKITIESFKEKFNITINKKNYILLENGSLIPTINPNNDLKFLEIIRNIDRTKILDYKVIFDMKYIKKIEDIEKKVKENIASIDISWLKYYERQRELHIVLNNFTRLIFSLDDNISVDEQIQSLAVLDRENSQIANNDKIYIDLRIKWKVFYCSIKNDRNKQKERQCNSNLENIYWQL